MFTRSILLLLSVTFIFSCKKFKDPEISYLVKTKTSSQTGNTETYTYDSENRIIRITNSTSSTFTTFEYVNDSVFQYHYKEDSTFDINAKYLFNSKKLQIEKLQLSPWVLMDEQERFSYDATDFLETYFYSVTDYTTNDTLFNDGANFTQRRGSAYGLAGNWTFTTTYTYFTNTNTIGNENFGKPFLGKSSANIVKSETQTTVNHFTIPETTTTSVIDFTYDFDNYGRVAAQYATTDASTIKTTFTYY